MDIPDHSIQIDVYASWPKTTSETDGEREESIFKLLSSDPGHYKDAPREGVRRVLEHVLKTKIPREEQIKTNKISWIRLSTTVGTNALLERKGAKHALVITKGFRDLLEIGNQSRPKIFDLAIKKPEVLYSKVIEIDERVTLVGYSSDPKRKEREIRFDAQGKMVKGYDGRSPEEERDVVQGISGEAVQVLQRPDENVIRQQLTELYDAGYRSLAIVFLHAYTYPNHEQVVEKIAKEVGFPQVSLSSQVSSTVKVVPRGTSTTCDAYLTPILMDYINGFFDGFDDSLRQGVESGDTDGKRTQVEFMSSDGGLTDVRTFSGLRSILSGPAGGVVGCALTSWDEKRKQPIIGLDMGGTSTDVSRFDGRYETVFETTTAGISVQSPQLDINTVAAGGGSRLFYRNALFTVGPESAGAHPGPACYRKGGPLAVTDANLLLGRLVPKYFPHIFGETEDLPLDVEASQKAFDAICEEINKESQTNKSRDEIAYGFLKVANESMCRPIRSLTEARGFDTTRHVLTGFGGASGQHACSIAKTLGIKTILVHTYSSVLSAYGMALADRVFELREPDASVFNEDAKKSLKGKLDKLRAAVKKELQNQGFEDKNIVLESHLNVRYDGTDTALMTLQPEDGSWDFDKSFIENYKQEFGFTLDRDIIVDDVRVRGVGKSWSAQLTSPFEDEASLQFSAASQPEEYVSVYFEECGRIDAPLYHLDRLAPGTSVKGPALILQETQTIVVDPDAEAKVLPRHVMITL